ncbi:MAG: acetylxylan esterase [Limisphaerales bacterium]
MRLTLPVAAVLLLASPHVAATAAGLRVLPPGERPNDRRLEPLKDLDGYFPFQPPGTREDWTPRAADVRRRILVSQGLWPMPTRTPLNPVIHGRRDLGEYTVEKVYFESMPGFFVTGNLYRPKHVTGKAPGILFAHGHWKDARLSILGDEELKEEIAGGQEKFEVGGRSRFQSMCVQLARMGCVVWQWDMLGDSDSQQLSRELVHGFAKQRPEMNTAENWGLFSPAAEAHLQSAMGLQTWNAVRSLDFLLGLPEVDPARVAVTGASGGGTQSFILAAVDDRVKLSFPAVMVSTAMQGGCTCENASLLRVGTGNVEFAALFAPKPQGMTTANDWTKEMATKGFPDLQRLYALLGAPDHVMLHRGEQFPHNYNAVSRTAFYSWLNRHFKLGFREPVLERDYQRLSREELTVWDAQHPAPKAADPDFERRLLRGWHEDTQRQLAAMDAGARRDFLRGAWRTVIGRGAEDAGEVVFNMTKTELNGDFGWDWMGGLLINRPRDERPVVLWLMPKESTRPAVVWLSREGKAGLLDAQGKPRPEVARLLEAGHPVWGVDLFMQGEFLAPDQPPVTETRRVTNPREAAAYTFGYNDTLFAQRVHDVLTVLAFVTKPQEDRTPSATLVAADGPMAAVAAAARAVSGPEVALTVLAPGDFRFGQVLDLRSPDFLPGAARYGDLPALLELGRGRLKLVKGGDDTVSALSE